MTTEQLKRAQEVTYMYTQEQQKLKRWFDRILTLAFILACFLTMIQF